MIYVTRPGDAFQHLATDIERDAMMALVTRAGEEANPDFN